MTNAFNFILNHPGILIYSMNSSNYSNENNQFDKIQNICKRAIYGININIFIQNLLLSFESENY